jgi:hypothetical protein
MREFKLQLANLEYLEAAPVLPVFSRDACRKCPKGRARLAARLGPDGSQEFDGLMQAKNSRHFVSHHFDPLTSAGAL